MYGKPTSRPSGKSPTGKSGNARAFHGTDIRGLLKLFLDGFIGLLESIEDHAEADRRTLADLPLEKTLQMSDTASPLIG